MMQGGATVGAIIKVTILQRVLLRAQQARLKPLASMSTQSYVRTCLCTHPAPTYVPPSWLNAMAQATVSTPLVSAKWSFWVA